MPFLDRFCRPKCSAPGALACDPNVDGSVRKAEFLRSVCCEFSSTLQLVPVSTSSWTCRPKGPPQPVDQSGGVKEILSFFGHEFHVQYSLGRWWFAQTAHGLAPHGGRETRLSAVAVG